MTPNRCTKRDRRLPPLPLLSQNCSAVFLQHQFTEMCAKEPADKVVDIVRKTWGKMGPKGQAAALALAPSLCVEQQVRVRVGVKCVSLQDLIWLGCFTCAHVSKQGIRVRSCKVTPFSFYLPSPHVQVADWQGTRAAPTASHFLLPTPSLPPFSPCAWAHRQSA